MSDRTAARLCCVNAGILLCMLPVLAMADRLEPPVALGITAVLLVLTTVLLVIAWKTWPRETPAARASRAKAISATGIPLR